MAEEGKDGWLTALITGGFATFVTIWKIIENRNKKKTTPDEDNLELEKYYQEQLKIRNRELTEEKAISSNLRREVEEGKKRESDLLRDLNQKERENTILRIQVKAKNT